MLENRLLKKSAIGVGEGRRMRYPAAGNEVTGVPLQLRLGYSSVE
jgi:hypothetical protein